MSGKIARTKTVSPGGGSDSDVFTRAVEQKLSQWAKQKPNEVVIGTAGSQAPLTRKQVHQHIVEETDLGQRLMKGWVDAAVRNVLKAKIK
jgi:hypothetical protein